MKKPSLAIFGVAFAALMLTGCAPGGETPAGGSSPEPTVTVSATPIETPTPTPEPVAEADFGFTTFHEAKLGDNWDQLSSALGHTVGPATECYHPYGALEETTDVVTMASWERDRGTGVNMFYTYFKTNDASGPFPRNAEGVGVGSTRAEVLAAYPDAVVEVVTPAFEGPVTRILVGDPDSESEYAFGISGYAGADIVDKLQWGLNGAGGVWEHLCGGS